MRFPSSETTGAAAAAAGGSFVLLASYSGLQILDLADPTQPRALGSCTSSSSSASGAKLLVEGNHAYLAAGSDGVSIWDL